MAKHSKGRGEEDRSHLTTSLPPYGHAAPYFLEFCGSEMLL